MKKGDWFIASTPHEHSKGPFVFVKEKHYTIYCRSAIDGLEYKLDMRKWIVKRTSIIAVIKNIKKAIRACGTKYIVHKNYLKDKLNKIQDF